MSADVSEIVTAAHVGRGPSRAGKGDIASTDARPGSLPITNERCAVIKPTSPVSKRSGCGSPSRLTQQSPFKTAKNLMVVGAGKRIAHLPPAVKPPVTSDSALISLSMSESGSMLISALLRKFAVFSSIHSTVMRL